jgi:Methylamine utilisation protein MauE
VAVLAVAGSTTGGWDRASIAVLAVAFCWAALAKLAGMRRWRRALSDHRLPPRLEAAVTWALPLAELAIPVMVVLGRERVAAGLALTALAVFSTALVRSRLLGGDRRVPCGCFGRDAVDVRTALGRNALLAAVAAVAWVTAGTDPPLRLPAGSDALPASIVVASVTAAAITAWRASVWFSRARG